MQGADDGGFVFFDLVEDAKSIGDGVTKVAFVELVEGFEDEIG